MHRPIAYIRRLTLFMLSMAVMTFSFVLYPVPTHAQAPIGTGVCTTNGLAVRSKPSTAGKKLGSISKGTKVTVYAAQNGWYQIAYKSNYGWVSGKYIKYTAGTPTNNVPSGVIGTGVVKTSGGSLNVRSGPGSGYAALGKVSNNSSHNIYEKQGSWYRILYNGKTGWVMSSYIVFTASHPTTPPSPTPSISPAPTPPAPTPTSPSPSPTPSPTNPPQPSGTIGSGTVINVSTYVNVRSGPSSSNTSIGKAYKNNVFPVYSVRSSWVEIDYNGRHAWISSSYFKVTLTAPKNPIVEAKSIYSYEQMQKDIASLKARYPDKITVSSIGKSVEGRNIPVLVVGNPNAANQILIHAGIHGREYMNPNLVMMQVEYILANANSVYDGQTFAQWMSDSCFHIIPMVNPDGVTISQTNSGSDNVLAICTLNLIGSSKLSSYLTLWKANANGVDLNNQFPSGWNEKESAIKPANADYKGEKPLSELEAKALAAYTQNHSFDVTISYHSTGSDIYVEYPLATDSTNAKSRSLGNAINALTGYSIDGTPLDEGAGYKDWALSEFGIPSVTIETGTVSCPLPLSQFSGIWDKNKNLWPVLVKWIRTNSK